MPEARDLAERARGGAGGAHLAGERESPRGGRGDGDPGRWRPAGIPGAAALKRTSCGVFEGFLLWFLRVSQGFLRVFLKCFFKVFKGF